MFKRYFILLLVLLPGCSVWEDFTTYFNLYFNTTGLFEEIEFAINEQERDLFSTQELIIPPSVNTQLTKVVEKCSKILQFNPESAYVDDALLMLGKSFYYQKNYQKALRKFEELIATQQESNLRLETNLWIGKSNMRLKNYPEALEILEKVRKSAAEEGEDELLKLYYIEVVGYYISIEENQTAIALINEFAETSDDDEVKAEIFYELGKLYQKVNEPENAITALQEVFEYSPGFDIELEANLELGRTLRLTEKYSEALEVFENMRSEDKYRDSYAVIDLEIGLTLADLGRIEEAIETLIVVDTAYTGAETSGAARFKLAKIYEYNEKNFDSAYAYYQKASLSGSKDYVKPASAKAGLFKRYYALHSEIFMLSDQLFYSENPAEYSKDSLAYVQDSIAYLQDSLRIMEELNLFSEHLQSIRGFEEGPKQHYRLDSLLARDTVNVDSILALDSTFLDSLYTMRFSRLDSLGIDTLYLDSLRIVDSIRTDSLEQLNRFDFNPAQTLENLDLDSLFRDRLGDRKRLKKPFLPSQPPESLRTMLVKNELELGNLFLTELDPPDSALYYYEDILSSYPDTKHYASVLYALGSYYLTIEEKEKSDSLFNIIYEDFRNESIVNAAADKLGKPLIDLEYDPAKELYAEAESEMLEKNYEASINKFYEVTAEYPESPVAPKALYASGWILENELKMYDSAAAVYDSINSKYPGSEYARKVKPKLISYKEYKKALQDSIRLAEQQKLDSLLLERTSADSLHLPGGDSLMTSSDSLQFEGDEIKITSEGEKAVYNGFQRADSLRRGVIDDPRRNLRRRR